MQNNTITLKGVTETYIILAVNGKEHEILLNSNAFELFLQSYNQTTFQSGNTIYNIAEIGTANFVFQIKSIAPKPKHLNHIPLALPPKVIGRKNDLEKVEELLFKDNALVIVNGIGGIGKTVLSHYYWQERQYKYTHLLWLKGEGNLQDSLVYDYNLHAGLGIAEEMKYHLEAIRQPNNAQAKEQAFACVAAALKNVTPKGLMLIDNATDENHWTIKQWKTTFDNFHILVTSRETFANVTTYKLGYLSELEAIELFYLYYDDPENNLPHDDAIVEGIVQKAGYHTLTIELLAMTLRDSDELTLATLSEKLAEHIVYISGKKKVLIDANYTQSRDYIDSIIEFAFDLSRLRKNEYALNLLTQISVLPSYNLRAEHLKQMLVSEGEEENKYAENMRVLWKAGWIERFHDENGWFYNCHAVVQEVVRGKERVCAEKCEKLILKLANLSIIPPDRNINHLLTWLPYSERILMIYLKEEKLILMLLRHRVALIFNCNHETSKSLYHHTICVSFFEDYNEGKNFFLGVLYSNIAECYRQLGNYKDALHYGLLGIKGHEDYPTENFTHSDITYAYETLAYIYLSLERFSDALSYVTKAMELRITQYGMKHIEVAKSYTNLGEIYRNLKQYEEALEYGVKGLKLVEELFPNKTNPLLTTSLNNISLVYSDLGNLPFALEYGLKSLLVKEKNLHSFHPNLAISYLNIAVIYFSMEIYHIALEYFQKAILINEKSLSLNHPRLGVCYRKTAECYEILGDLNQSFIFYKKAVVLEEQQDSINYEYLLSNLIAVSDILIKQKRNLEADQYLTCAFIIIRDIFDKIISKNYDYLAEIYGQLTIIYMNIPNYFQALFWGLKAIDIFENQLPHKKEAYGVVCGDIGLCYLHLRRWKPALYFLHKEFNLMEVKSTETNSELRKILLMTMFGILKQVSENEPEQFDEEYRLYLVWFQQEAENYLK